MPLPLFLTVYWEYGGNFTWCNSKNCRSNGHCEGFLSFLSRLACTLRGVDGSLMARKHFYRCQVSSRLSCEPSKVPGFTSGYLLCARILRDSWKVPTRESHVAFIAQAAMFLSWYSWIPVTENFTFQRSDYEDCIPPMTLYGCEYVRACRCALASFQGKIESAGVWSRPSFQIGGSMPNTPSYLCHIGFEGNGFRVTPLGTSSLFHGRALQKRGVWLLSMWPVTRKSGRTSLIPSPNYTFNAAVARPFRHLLSDT